MTRATAISHRDLDFGSPSDYGPTGLEAPRVEGSGRQRRLVLAEGCLEGLAREAFAGIAFHLPSSWLEGLAAVAADRESPPAERFVALSLLRNAVVAAEGFYPLCQDTGSAVVYGWKGEAILSGTDDEAALARGAATAYKSRLLRASILGPRGFIEEANTGNNLPLHADLRAVEGASYRLIFSAKGGGSQNKTSLSMETPALLEPAILEARLAALTKGLGPSACPPYRIACVLGGLSPDEAAYTLALAVLGLLDGLPLGPTPGEEGGALRDTVMEGRLMALAGATGIGAQFGGRHLALDARAIRLPRHAASLPLAFGVGCVAMRKARAIIDEEGVRLERLEADPARFLPPGEPVFPEARRVDLSRPIAEVAKELGDLPPGSPVLLSGKVLTARDKAHARFHALIAEGKPLPEWLSRHPVFYAGPTEAAPGRASGSFGPTTAGRMDAYLPELLARGASLVSIAKGSRSPGAVKAIAAAGGAYLCAIGGAAALAGERHIVSSSLVAYPELGMEAVRLVELRDLPAIVGINAQGRDFYAERGEGP